MKRKTTIFDKGRTFLFQKGKSIANKRSMSSWQKRSRKDSGGGSSIKRTIEKSGDKNNRQDENNSSLISSLPENENHTSLEQYPRSGSLNKYYINIDHQNENKRY